jgi:hypothetical protein
MDSIRLFTAWAWSCALTFTLFRTLHASDALPAGVLCARVQPRAAMRCCAPVGVVNRVRLCRVLRCACGRLAALLLLLCLPLPLPLPSWPGLDLSWCACWTADVKDIKVVSALYCSIRVCFSACALLSAPCSLQNVSVLCCI